MLLEILEMIMKHKFLCWDVVAAWLIFTIQFTLCEGKILKIKTLKPS